MARILRTTTVGVRVTKAPSVRTGCASAYSIKEDMEPRVINRKSHKKFVRNMFSIRGKAVKVA